MPFSNAKEYDFNAVESEMDIKTSSIVKAGQTVGDGECPDFLFHLLPFRDVSDDCLQVSIALNFEKAGAYLDGKSCAILADMFRFIDHPLLFIHEPHKLRYLGLHFRRKEVPDINLQQFLS